MDQFWDQRVTLWETDTNQVKHMVHDYVGGLGCLWLVKLCCVLGRQHLRIHPWMLDMTFLHHSKTKQNCVPPNSSSYLSLVSQMDSLKSHAIGWVILSGWLGCSKKKGHSVCTSSLQMVVSAYHIMTGRSTLTLKKLHTSDLTCMLNKAWTLAHSRWQKYTKWHIVNHS